MMNCSHPMVPNAEELLRYVLDEEPFAPEVSEHMAQCSLCQQHVLHYQQVNGFLLKNLYRSTCPSATQLNMYCAHLLDVEDVEDVERHLRFCPLCAQEVGEIGQILADFEPFPEMPITSQANTP